MSGGRLQPDEGSVHRPHSAMRNAVMLPQDAQEIEEFRSHMLAAGSLASRVLGERQVLDAGASEWPQNITASAPV